MSMVGNMWRGYKVAWYRDIVADASSPSQLSPTSPVDNHSPSPLSPPQIEIQAPIMNQSRMPPSWAQDITIGTARGKYYRVKDAWMFPGSYSSPVLNTLLGGVDDILDSNGHEEANGWSFFVFRRPLVPTDDDIDHPLAKG